MSTQVNINLRRFNKVYHQNERLTGFISIDNKKETSHEGIILHVEGSVSIHSDPKHAKLLSALQSPNKPILLIGYSVEVSKSGRLPAGRTDIPFELPLVCPGNDQILYETYHGVFITIQYNLRCEMRRSLLSKDIQEIYEFIIEYDRQPARAPSFSPRTLEFEVTPDSLQQAHKRDPIPNFKISGKLTSSICVIDKPFTGEFIVEYCDSKIRSVELQLVRVETHGNLLSNNKAEYNKDATEVQNIQIGEGDIERGTKIPIYMIFPRLFTCPTLRTNSFSIGTLLECLLGYITMLSYLNQSF